MPAFKQKKTLLTPYLRLVLLVFTVFSAVTLAGCNLVPGGLDRSSTGSVTLYWSRPIERFNGELLEESDIAGYSIRYRHESKPSFTRIFIENDGVNSYFFKAVKDPAKTIFQVAAVDQAGIYSNYETAVR
jgi:hypothetical protein